MFLTLVLKKLLDSKIHELCYGKESCESNFFLRKPLKAFILVDKIF